MLKSFSLLKFRGKGIENGAIGESSFHCFQTVFIRNDVMFDSFHCIMQMGMVQNNIGRLRILRF